MTADNGEPAADGCGSGTSPFQPAARRPLLEAADALALVPAALGIFLVSFSDEILTARSFAGRHGQHVRAATELAAMGAASSAAGITQAFPVGASGSRTAVNDQIGGRTQLSGLLGAAAIAVVVLAAAVLTLLVLRDRKLTAGRNLRALTPDGAGTPA